MTSVLAAWDALWWISSCGVPLAIVGTVVVLIARRGLHVKRLVEGGVDGEATILAKFRSGGRGGGVPYVRYEFHDPFQHRFERKVAVTEEEYERLDVGTTVAVVYLPDDPRVNALASLVARSRAALPAAREPPAEPR